MEYGCLYFVQAVSSTKNNGTVKNVVRSMPLIKEYLVGIVIAKVTAEFCH